MKSCTQPELMLAIDACLAHAKTELFRGIADVADAMETKPTRDAVYKWVQSGRMPLVEVAAFERACGASSISRHLAAAGGNLLIKESVAAGLPQLDFARVQCQVAKAMFATASALVDPTQAQQAMQTLSQAMDGLATVRHQISKGSLK